MDGSEVELDAQSAIDVAYDSRERRVRLLEGSAIFRAAPRAGRVSRPARGAARKIALPSSRRTRRSRLS
ncbi:FecR domain-containing protein [Pseudomonas aeruginosa]|uniref:FecR domain-containing protein n=1 Tax=Pseudomonas aeruginosa TaxID=287 RepID=UPI003D7697D5